ncbi:unnamed protein product [Periconia digitata]|uniref:Chromo domain-containing protein n=1 Tax=Periconia digitata TaxID=1303443 RepID=A0A9W4UA47_9PLEO|nr:unnamed protein product [Periconia digitata]
MIVRLSLDEYDRHYDTDDVSVTSTVPDDQAIDGHGYFEVEAILSEGNNVDDGTTVYLTKWQGYPPHECTWEPREHIENTGMLRLWEANKRKMSEDDFTELADSNHDLFEEAKIKAQELKQKRQLKRKKKRKRRAPAQQPPDESDDSNEDVPLIARKRAPGQQTQRSSENEQHRDSNSNPNKRASLNRPRVIVIDSSDSSDEASDDFLKPLFDDTGSEPRANGGLDSLFYDVGSEPTAKGHEVTQRSARSTELALVPGPSKEKRHKTTRISTAKDMQEKRSEVPAHPSATKGLQRRRGSGSTVDNANASATKTASTNATHAEKSGGKSGAHTSTSKAVRGKPSSAKDAATTTKSGPSTSKPMTKITPSNNKDTARIRSPIRIVNGPKPRSRESKTTRHFQTLHARDSGRKRFQAEGTPDPASLEFVNGIPTGKAPPRAQPKTSIQTTDNPFGRRESSSRRLVYNSSPSPPPTYPLQPYEIDKVPMVCLDFRSGNCPYSAQDCRFMHRHTSPSGRPYKVGPLDGKIPGKYLKPALTCHYWLRTAGGCTKTAEDCDFAHRNTGRVKPGPNHSVEIIDRNEIPVKDKSTNSTQAAEKPISPSQAAMGFISPPQAAENPITLTQAVAKPVAPTQPTKKPVAPTQPTEKPVAPTQLVEKLVPPAQPAEKSILPTQPTGKPVSPTQPPTRKPVSPTQPVEKLVPPAQPAEKPMAPTPASIHRFIDPLPLVVGRHDPTTSVAAPVAQIPMKNRITCRYWLRGYLGCKMSPEACNFAHWNTGRITAHNGIDINEQPLFVPERTCYFWNQHECPKEDQCENAHKYTGFIATAPPGWKSKITAHDKYRYKDGYTEQYTCYLWTQSMCEKKPESCHFVHAWGGIDVADPPLGFVQLPSIHGQQSVQPTPGHAQLDKHKAPVQTPGAQGEEKEGDDLVNALPVIHMHRPKNATLAAAQPTLSVKSQAPATPVEKSTMDLKKRIEQACKLNFKEMFVYNSETVQDATLDKRAFLVFHPCHHLEELEVLTRWLLIHHVEVFNFWSNGGEWDAFKNEIAQGGTGIVITHPDFELFAEISGFSQILKANVRIWSIGHQPGLEFDTNLPHIFPDIQYRYDRIEIFPHGGIVYITDDVFLNQPTQALDIIKHFIAKVEACRRIIDGPIDPWRLVDFLPWRIGVRPDFMEFLYNTVLRYEAVPINKNPNLQAAIAARRSSLLALYKLLSAYPYIEQDIPYASENDDGTGPNPAIPDPHPPYSTRADDFFPIISERRAVMEDTFYRALSVSQSAANTSMVEYFGDMLLVLRHSYRRYFVVHSTPKDVSAQDWVQRINVLEEVITPERCMELLRNKEGKGFEFFEWASFAEG